MHRHTSDYYVKQSLRDGYRSRSAYKLLEIQKKDHILKSGLTVLDLGSAPGGWSQVAAQCVGKSGKVIALDLLCMDEISGVNFLQGDFTQLEIIEQLKKELAGHKVDVVLSDMAPNMSGVRSVDQAKSMYLAELCLEFAVEMLCTGGHMLIKMFQGEDVDHYFELTRKQFAKVITRKPKSSRPKSREFYLLGYDKLK